mmetsp:Transcript_11466/g.11792  ORF Transcript_11466/g.11792 Transcript_11466/m.11792 type:complete len:132 (+) Transcript_11466:16-411(+)
METIEKNNDYIKIYPNYIDKEVKVSEGRRVNMELAIPNVTAEEIFNAATRVLLFKCEPQYKHHAQDWMKRGRILLKLKEGGKPILPNINTKSKILKEISSIILKHREVLEQEKSKQDDKDNQEGKKKKRRN